jgi:hypothetical protein
MLCSGECYSAQDICSQVTFVITDIPACVYGVLKKTYCSKATVEDIVIESCCKIEYILGCAPQCAIHCIQVAMFVMEMSPFRVISMQSIFDKANWFTD